MSYMYHLKIRAVSISSFWPLPHEFRPSAEALNSQLVPRVLELFEDLNWRWLGLEQSRLLIGGLEHEFYFPQ
jgi:hypothetical protein